MSGFFFPRCEEDQVDPLGDHRVDVGHLLGSGSGSIGIDQLMPELLGLGLHAVGLCDAPGVVGFRLREADLVGLLLRELRQFRECDSPGDGDCASRGRGKHERAA